MWYGRPAVVAVFSAVLRTWTAGGSGEPYSRPWEGRSKTIRVPSSRGYRGTRDKILRTAVGALQVQRGVIKKIVQDYRRASMHLLYTADDAVLIMYIQ